MPKQQRGRSRRPSTIWLLLGVMTLLAAAIAGGYLVYRTSQVDTLVHVKIRTGESTTTVDLSSSGTIADALVEAGISPHNGRLLSAKDKRVLDPLAHPAKLTIDGLPATADYPLSDGVFIEVTDGVDEVEPTKVEEEVVPAPMLRESMQTVHEAGHDGLVRKTIGVRSGEVVSTEVLKEATAPVQTERKVVALTFDDGPTEEWTPQFLDLLKEKGVKATFCQVGSNVQKHPDIVQRVVDEGHQLCNHTVDHDEGLKGADRARVEASIGGGVRAFTTEGFKDPKYYRPPGGALDDQIKDVAWSYGEEVIHWKVDTKDWESSATVESVLANLNAQVKNGAIILLHDGGGKSRAVSLFATSLLIDQLKTEGYEFVFPIMET